MRKLLPLSLLFLLAAGCGGSSATNAPTPQATSKGVPPVHTGPIPASSPVKGAHLPTVNPHATPAVLPTPKPLPTATAFPASAYTAQVHGIVTNSKTKAPIPDVTITIGANLKIGHTDAFGHYAIAFPAGAPVPVFATAKGYSGGLAMGRILPHRKVNVDFRLNPIEAGKPVVPPAPIGFGQ